ncbi:MAG: phosphoribosylformylglycinamidine synthase subunit PurS [Proteobacteria bacterium]|nr:phosphoribosylformylglycinamidine synthase subunit PurS [Pseudomonadota bacterium]
MTANVHITLKGGVLDPQGKAVESALSALGFSGIEGVRQGKFIELKLVESDKEKARLAVRAMCEKLLANTIIEDYAVDIVD